MIYNPDHHITHAELASKLGLANLALSSKIKKENGPESFVARIKSNNIVMYDRFDVDVWLKSAKETPEPYKGETVLAATPKPITEQGTYSTQKHNPQLAMNQQRAAELYPHRIRSQGRVVGNEAVYQRGFGERA